MEINFDKELTEELNDTANKIRTERKNLKIAEKEAAEFEEIRKILECSNKSLSETPESLLEVENIVLSKYSKIPLSVPEVRVFKDELIFSLFGEGDCQWEKFVSNEEKCLIASEINSIPSEETFRELIAYHIAGSLLSVDGSFDSVGVYILYLMSVHPDPEFVTDCLDFLKEERFQLRPEDIISAFVNFGAECFEFPKEIFSLKGVGNVSATEFPYFNLEMVGEILLHYINENRIIITPEIKSLIRGLVRVLSDRRIRTGRLLPIYGTVLTGLCSLSEKEFSLEEILSWVDQKEEDLLNQVEICRILSGTVYQELREALVLATIRHLLKSESLSTEIPIQVDCVKSVLKELKKRELSPVEIYSLFQLINSSLPGITATVEDSVSLISSYLRDDSSHDQELRVGK